MVSPADIRAWKAQAAQAAARGEVRQSLALYARLAEAEPAEPEWRVRAAEVHQTLGRTADAARAYRDAAMLYARTGFELRAVAACRAALQLQPDEPETNRLLAALVPGTGAPPTPSVRPPSVRPAAGDDGHVSLGSVDITGRLRAVNPDAVRTDAHGGGVTDVALGGHDVDDPGYTDLVLDDLAEIQEVSAPARAVQASQRPPPAGPGAPMRKPTPSPASHAGPGVSPRKPTPPPVPAAGPGAAFRKVTPPPAVPGVPGRKPTPPPVPVRSGIAPRPPEPRSSAPAPAPVSTPMSTPAPRVSGAAPAQNAARSERSLEDEFDALDASDDLFAPRGGGAAASAPPATTSAVRPAQNAALSTDAVEVPAGPPARPVDPGLLKGLPLLGTLPPEVLETFVRRIRQITVAPGDRVINEGEIADTVYLVVRGDLVAARGSPPRPLARLGEGTFFGEMALLDNAPRSASVVAVTDAELLVLPRDLVLEICDTYPTVLEKLMQALRARLIATLTATSPLFQSIPAGERAGIVAKFRLREIEPGTQFIREGRRADGLYVVLTGRVQVSASGGAVAELTTGDVAGEVSLLSQGGASATVTALTRVTALMLPSGDLQEIIMVHPEVLEHLSRLSDARTSAPPESASQASKFPAMNLRRV